MFKCVIVLFLPTIMTALKVYYVMPDNEAYNSATNKTAFTLTHYLKYSPEYITSNTQMKFLPGKFNLSSNFAISNISNFSIVGNQQKLPVIQCSNSSIMLYNCTNVTIHGLELTGCATHASDTVSKTSSLSLLYCSNVMILYLTTDYIVNNYGILVINTLGNSTIQKITSNGIKIVYDLGMKSFNIIHLAVSHFKRITRNSSSKFYAVNIAITNYCSIVKINLTDIIFSTGRSIIFKSDTRDGLSSLYIRKVSFISVTKPKGTAAISVTFTSHSNKVYKLVNKIRLIYCKFINVSGLSHLIMVKSYQNGYVYSEISISRSNFYNNSHAIILASETGSDSTQKPHILIHLSYVKIYSIKQVKCVLYLEETNLLLLHVVLTHISSNQSVLEAKNSQINFKSYVEFSTINSIWCIVMDYVSVEENTIVNFTGNKVLGMFTLPHQKQLYTLYEKKMQSSYLCIFQFVNRKHNLDKKFYQGEQFNYSILFEHNKGIKLASTKYALHHCSWTSDSAFTLANSKEINQKLIHFNKNNFTKTTDIKKTSLCRNNYIDYTDDIVGPIYPGQTLNLTIYVNKVITFQIKDLSPVACKVFSSDISNNMQAAKNTCTSFLFSVQHKSERGCELYLQGMLMPIQKGYPYLDYMKFVDAYYVTFNPCPRGFVLNTIEGKCLCDPLLKVLELFSSITCNINDQTILRPPNTWISATTINNSHTYDVSLQCPFDYCLSHSSNLALSEADGQCKYHRVGTLCGYCPENFSSIFGSSRCKLCSNIYLLVIIPITVAGLILVLLLFSLNFTVTDGDINGIILYANIISINDYLFFSTGRNFDFVYVSISLLNLDLGIETCFYNGMDDYAKLWLQLVFPFYLFMLVIFFIIASRHSSKLQRLTARRILPVLATLILLSFTKVLRTTSTALFFYSTIIHLPGEHATLVWSVDLHVALFGIKFTILFTICFILFFVLLQFTLLLVFTRTLSWFKIINRFKPLLDAYQGPYKSKYYYWTGLQLAIRAVLFGLSALSRDTNIMVSTIVIGTNIFIQGVVNPFKSRRQNIHELFLLLNLLILFTVTQYTTANSIAVHTLVSLAILQFMIILLNHIRLHLCSKFSNSSVNSKILKIIAKLENGILGFENATTLEENERKIIHAVINVYENFQEPLIRDFDI